MGGGNSNGAAVSTEDEESRVPLLATVDDMIEQSLGNMNWMQIFQTILVSATPLLDSQQTFISVFAHATPPWHCTTNTSASCSSNSNICSLPRSEWGWDSGDATHTSIVSEWDLQCATSFIAGLPTTCFFVGCLLGGTVLPTLGDTYLGRKNLLSLCLFIMCLAAFASAFSPNLWVYSLLRFVSGFGRAPLAVCVMVLLTERVAKRWRSPVLLIAFFALALGPLSLSGVAYLTRELSWRTLYLCTSIPGLICTALSYFFMYESPRWLFTQGRTNDAMTVLAGLGRSTTTKIGVYTEHHKVQPTTTTTTTTTTTNNNNPLESLKLLKSKRWAVKRLIASVIPAFGIGLVYFGLFLGAENLGYNIYLTLVLDGLLSLSTYLLTFLWWLQHCNRRSSLVGFCTVGGVLSMLLCVIDESEYGVLPIVVQLMSLFCACMGVNLVAMYNVELFPTCVRNSASSIVRLSMVLASVFVPTLNSLGKKSLIYSDGISGLVMLLSGFFVLYLPETRGKALCDTMEEQEIVDNDDDTNLIA